MRCFLVVPRECSSAGPRYGTPRGIRCLGGRAPSGRHHHGWVSRGGWGGTQIYAGCDASLVPGPGRGPRRLVSAEVAGQSPGCGLLAYPARESHHPADKHRAWRGRHAHAPLGRRALLQGPHSEHRAVPASSTSTRAWGIFSRATWITRKATSTPTRKP